ncbi:transposase [Bdellovibrionota bacterium FG-1]
MKLLASGVSQRRNARLLGIDRKTLVRKFLFWAQQASLSHQAFLESLAQGENKIKEAQFDEMETFEKSKCLPLSVPLVVETKSRKILGFRVCEMPSKGMLVEKSLKKYGHRHDGRPAAAASLFAEIAKVLDPQAEITSDQNPKYPSWIKKSLPQTITHKTIKGSRGCIVGQGELKKTGFDPLFSFNHTAAMLRANINRLFRRTWCTTKRKDRLAAHIAIYVYYHNTVLTESPST